MQYIFERLMKRKALMIGNSRGVKATPLDMLHFTQFLMSYQGGAWTRDEIEPWMDKDVNELLNDVEKIVKGQNDYVIVYFTGHGGLHGDTIIEVNPKGELIKENSLFGLADRQLNILDCCRNIQTTPLPIYGRSRGMGTMEQGLRDAVRAEYDELVMNAAPQFVKMYSCAEDESSYATKTGSYYTTNLIACSKELLNNHDVARIYQCHEATALKTTADVLKGEKREQHPVIIPTKCLGAAELPLCFNPVVLK